MLMPEYGTLTSPEYLLQLGSQLLGLQDPPRMSPSEDEAGVAVGI